MHAPAPAWAPPSTVTSVAVPDGAAKVTRTRADPGPLGPPQAAAAAASARSAARRSNAAATGAGAAPRPTPPCAAARAPSGPAPSTSRPRPSSVSPAPTDATATSPTTDHAAPPRGGRSTALVVPGAVPSNDVGDSDRLTGGGDALSAGGGRQMLSLEYQGLNYGEPMALAGCFIDGILADTWSPPTWKGPGPLPNHLDGLKQTQIIAAILASAQSGEVAETPR